MNTDRSQTARFTAQSATADDLLRADTVGLVGHDDFKKRRADALERHESLQTSDGRSGSLSGASTPGDGGASPRIPSKKKRKAVVKGKLSFAPDGDEGEERPTSASSSTISAATSTDALHQIAASSTETRRRLGANSTVAAAPRLMTKSALLKEAKTRESLRKDFVSMQEAVKATEFLMPFVFYDGTNTPGGVCKVKKGDHVWLFLDRSRKVGADLGVSNNSEKTNVRREWARVGVDDLLLVRGEIIIPPHYDFYYFILNQTAGRDGRRLFPYSTQPLPAPTQSEGEETSAKLLMTAAERETQRSLSIKALEGADEDPTFTKVVDRRWYERNKHIFPASIWEEFDPSKDYTRTKRRDGEGNTFFFS